MTTFHTFDDMPPPSDFELEAADRRRRARPDWMHDAIIEMEDAADEAATQQGALSVLF